MSNKNIDFTTPVNFWTRLRLYPFEIAFAGVAIAAGLVGIFNVGTTTDVLNLLIPGWLVQGLNFLYCLSGISIVVGLVVPRRDVEAFGLTQLLAAVVVRGVAVAVVAGLSPDTVALFALYLLIGWAAVVRIQQLFRSRK